MLYGSLKAERIPPPGLRGQPLPQDMRMTGVNLAQLSAVAPSKWQPMPGVAQLWKARKVFKPMVRWEENCPNLLQEEELEPVE